MGNSLTKNLITGTIGELLVQIRLLEYGVQAAPPIKDSGNDLIAVKGNVVRYIQVKTKLNGSGYSGRTPNIYHLLIHVDLVCNDDVLLLDQSKINVFNNRGENLGELTSGLVKTIWALS